VIKIICDFKKGQGNTDSFMFEFAMHYFTVSFLLRYEREQKLVHPIYSHH